MVTRNDHNSGIIQLRYGRAVLIDVRMPLTEQDTAGKKIMGRFCEEVEFLQWEYKAREEAAKDILGRGIANELRSRIVKLKLGKKVFVGDKIGRGGVQEKKSVKPRLKLKLGKAPRSEQIVAANG